MFTLSRRKGSDTWQVRKRWPKDCTAILGTEFIRSTGETDKEKAADKLPLIAAEYRSKVSEARSRAIASPGRILTEVEAHRLAAEFFNSQLPAFTVTNRMERLDHSQLLKSARSRLAAAQEMLGRNDYSPVLAAGRTLLRQAGITEDTQSQPIEYLQRMLMRAFVELHRAAVARLEGDAAYTPHDADLVSAPAEAQGPAQRIVAELLVEYEAAKIGGWSPSSKRAFGPVARLLREEFGDRAIDSISREDARQFVAMIQQRPVGMGTRAALRDLSAREAIAKGQALGIPALSTKTVNDGYIVHVVAVFNWAVTEGWLTSHPFHKLKVKDTIDDADRRDPFTAEQVRSLFTAAPWDRPWDASRGDAARYWIPLLCLFHGFRLKEAVGLRAEDVSEAEGILVIKLQPNDVRSLKNAAARSTMPIHPELIRLGFAEFAAQCGAGYLFPAEVEQGVGHRLSAWFSSHVRSKGFEGRKLGMHSFRHGFEDRLREAGLPERTAAALSRRSEGGAKKGYGDGLSLRAKLVALEQVRYPALNLWHLAR
jgi:integrase